MTSLTPGLGVFTNTCSGVNGDWFLNDKTIGDQLPDTLSLKKTRALSMVERQTAGKLLCVPLIINLREFVLAISLISLGSNQTFFRPHRITEAASLFCNFKELKQKKCGYVMGRI